jgi:cbb3-type cytochrome oxidase maturation protein
VTILYVLVPLGLVLTLLAVGAFFWAVNAGQFEDLDAGAVSPLEDDPVPAPSAPGAPPTG